MNTYTAKWETLCRRFLPFSNDASIWRYSRLPAASDPLQGWKLHVSATLLTANTVLERLGPLLTDLQVLFKAPSSLEELSRINSGVYYGYSQVGKCFTIYPATDDDSVALLDEGVHGADFLRWMFGDPQTVTAFVSHGALGLASAPIVFGPILGSMNWPLVASAGLLGASVIAYEFSGALLLAMDESRRFILLEVVRRYAAGELSDADYRAFVSLVVVGVAGFLVAWAVYRFSIDTVRGIPLPLTMGHETVGRIEGTDTVVTVNPVIGCGDCPQCAAGTEQRATLAISRSSVLTPASRV